MCEADLDSILCKLSGAKVDFPRLNEEVASIVTTNLADEIYDSLKDKSASSEGKRQLILNFIQALSTGNKYEGVEDHHLEIQESNRHILVEAVSKTLPSDEWEAQIQQLQPPPERNLCTQVLEFNSRKSKHKQKQMAQAELARKHSLQGFYSTIPYSETTENYITSLLGPPSQPNEAGAVTSEAYRKKQIKFAYSLVYYKEWHVLKKLLFRLASYESCLEFEVNFLTYLERQNGDFQKLIIDKFPFVYEKTVIRICTKVLKAESDEDVGRFLQDPDIERISRIIAEDLGFKLRLHCMVFELYSFSNCNKNLFEFMERFLDV